MGARAPTLLLCSCICLGLLPGEAARELGCLAGGPRQARQLSRRDRHRGLLGPAVGRGLLHVDDAQRAARRHHDAVAIHGPAVGAGVAERGHRLGALKGDTVDVLLGREGKEEVPGLLRGEDGVLIVRERREADADRRRVGGHR